MFTQTLPRLLGTALVLSLCLSACDSDSADEGIDGAYRLKSMTGFDADLGDQSFPGGEPVTVSIDGLDVTVTVDGTMTLTPSDTWTMNMSISIAVPGFGTETESFSGSGTYRKDGSAVVFSGNVDGEAFSETGTLNGETLTLTDEGATLVFER